MKKLLIAIALLAAGNQIMADDQIEAIKNIHNWKIGGMAQSISHLGIVTSLGGWAITKLALSRSPIKYAPVGGPLAKKFAIAAGLCFISERIASEFKYRSFCNAAFYGTRDMLNSKYPKN